MPAVPSDTVRVDEFQVLDGGERIVYQGATYWRSDATSELPAELGQRIETATGGGVEQAVEAPVDVATGTVETAPSLPPELPPADPPVEG